MAKPNKSADDALKSATQNKAVGALQQQRLKRLDWHLLEAFRVAGRLQHVTRAAKELGTSQPALSRALARLEANLSTPLFQKVGRSIRLTRDGAMFLTCVERALGEIDEGRLRLAKLAGPESGTISLGFLRTLGARYVPNLVRQFATKFPKIKFTFSQNNSTAIEEQLEHGDLDLVFTAVPPGRTTLGWSRVADQNLILIVPHTHRLARRKRAALREVAGDPFISFKRGHAIRHFSDQLCQTAGFVPSIRFEGDDSSSIAGFVTAGFGVAIVPPESSEFADVVRLTITEPRARRAIGIAWVDDRFLSASVRAFRDFVVRSGSSVRPGG